MEVRGVELQLVSRNIESHATAVPVRMKVPSAPEAL
jgi:hypothetical protein